MVIVRALRRSIALPLALTVVLSATGCTDESEPGRGTPEVAATIVLLVVPGPCRPTHPKACPPPLFTVPPPHRTARDRVDAATLFVAASTR